VETVVEASPIAGREERLPVGASPEMLQSVADPIPDIAALTTTSLVPNNGESSAPEDLKSSDFARKEPQGWQNKMSALAQDIISERIISMRRVDYTTAILQGAAAGAVITTSIIAMLRTT
jgi:sensitive to high expression protein 9